jgi:hypothetical protein
MVEEATQAEEDPAVTFVRVRKLAEPIAGLARRESHRPTPRGGGRAGAAQATGQFGPLQQETAGRVVRPRRKERSDDGTLQAVVRGN